VRVGLFITCFNDTLFPQVGRATVEVLERQGVEVDVPLSQTCCGQMHFNSGYRDECIPMVARFTDAFAGYDAVSRRRRRAPRWCAITTPRWPGWPRIGDVFRVWPTGSPGPGHGCTSFVSS
jgi:hypothetical protein